MTSLSPPTPAAAQALRGMSFAELAAICGELRSELIESVRAGGGHFAASLGVTELTVMLHAIFDTPNDAIIWDVGHQAYIHKMLTGRRDALGSIRSEGGISGFLKRCESEHDAFGAGHAGTSISAALGMRLALNAAGSKHYVIAVIGDGSMTAGMAYEALNHAGGLHSSGSPLGRFLVVYNDNGMSISENVGALHQPRSGNGASDADSQRAFSFFTSLGFGYAGPIDGHDLDALHRELSAAKASNYPLVLHVKTIKGKGFAPAEADPVKWHSVTPAPSKDGPLRQPLPTFTSVFADTLLELAAEDPRIVAITAAMAGGTGLDRFAAFRPDAFFDVGICEQHAVTMAAGMACKGARPVCAIYSTFLQRAFDQVLHDVCVQNLPVTFVLDRGGLVGNDGETHQGVFDICFLRSIPNLVLMSPKDENELRHMLCTALAHNGPCAIRFPRGNAIGAPLDGPCQLLPIGKAVQVANGYDALLVAYGPMTNVCLEARKKLLERKGYTCAVINARFVKPLDEAFLLHELARYPLICTVEDHARMGGFGSALLELVHDHRLALQAPIYRFGVDDCFVPHASQQRQHEKFGLDVDSLVKFLEEKCQTACRRLHAIAS